MSHTPGPWVYSYKPDGRSFRVVAPRVHVICEDVQGRTDAEIEANVRLLAAAPDMLEILRQVDEDMGWLADANSPNSKLGKAVTIPIERVRALLKQVTGQA